MTAQIPDRILFEGTDYSITGIRGAELFNPAEHGLAPLPYITSCWRGFACHYALVERRLLLMTLRINLSEPPETLLGAPRSTAKEGVSFAAEYQSLSHEIPFTGELLAGDDFIQELYVHMGFHPAWKFRRVQHFTFVDGLLLAQRDRSEEAAAFRKKVAKNPGLGMADIPETFRLGFDPWAGSPLTAKPDSSGASLMKAIIWTKYGSPDGLQLREVAKPTPKDSEVLIRVHAATASQADTEFRRLKLPLLYSIPLRLFLGFRKPTRITILGTEFAGEIVSVGKDVTRYVPGDQVFGYTGLGMGTYAEYLCLSEKPSALAGVMGEKPANLSYEEAAAVPFGGLEALHSLGRAGIQSGQRVLIVGAGGSIGSYSVQLARHFGAEVTGVDSGGKLEMVRSIGADHVIDYTREDFTRNGQTYDVIFDTIGKSPFSGSLGSLKENGTYLNGNPGLLAGLRGRWASKRSGKRIMLWSGDYSVSNLLALKELIEAGTLRPVIDRRYPLEQIVEAHRYVDTGQKKGNVVITVVHDSQA